ncbi:short chain dehydrogenase/reductase SDR [Penicillium lividum]|nr:short chain dehydrogenase/reductase SDR [Penicillium lividum]
MNGTVLITGANGSLALGFAQSFLSLYPEHTLIATVRNLSPEKDPNTAKLIQLVSKYPNANVHIEALDLSSLSNVRSFAEKLSTRIRVGELPRLTALICNAASISLGSGQKFTSDGYETTFQVSHLSHYLLVLKLLESMDVHSGRIVMLGSITHYPEKSNPLYSLKTRIPDDIEELVKPGPDPPSLIYDRGFQRYGIAKLSNVTFANDLNKRLKKDPKLSNVSAISMDPGGLPSSRGQAEQKRSVRFMFAVINFLMPVLKHLTTDFRTTEDSGRDLVAVSLDPMFHVKSGYFVGQIQGSPAAVSEDLESQKRLWDACWRWARLRDGETILRDCL